MGTRGAWGYRMNGRDKVTYNHFDSYLEGLGKEVVSYVNNHTIEEHKKICEAIQLVKESKKPTQKQLREVCALLGEKVEDNKDNDWYSVLRATQGEPEYYAKGLKYMIDSHEFLYDSLFCEWAYIINLDTCELEIYKGFNRDKNALGRYASKCTAWNRKKPKEEKYYGVVLVRTASFKDDTKIQI